MVLDGTYSSFSRVVVFFISIPRAPQTKRVCLCSHESPYDFVYRPIRARTAYINKEVNICKCALKRSHVLVLLNILLLVLRSGPEKGGEKKMEEITRDIKNAATMLERRQTIASLVCCERRESRKTKRNERERERNKGWKPSPLLLRGRRFIRRFTTN